MSKLITSVAALILFEESALGLDDPVERFLPALGKRKVLRTDAGKPMLVLGPFGAAILSLLGRERRRPFGAQNARDGKLL